MSDTPSRLWPESVKRLDALVLAAQNAAPLPEVGTLYMDDGTNTSTSQAGIRVYKDGAWKDIPDFDHGEWTPLLAPSGTGSFTHAAGTKGTWTRTGSRVDIEAYIQLSARSGTIGGNLNLSGLPFRSDTNGPTFTLINIAPHNIGVGAGLTSLFFGRLGPAATSMRLISPHTIGGVFQNYQASGVQPTSIFYVSGSYVTDFV